MMYVKYHEIQTLALKTMLSSTNLNRKLISSNEEKGNLCGCPCVVAELRRAWLTRAYAGSLGTPRDQEGRLGADNGVSRVGRHRREKCLPGSPCRT